jgi:tetratricopeptide (TPR) repeat protein
MEAPIPPKREDIKAVNAGRHRHSAGVLFSKQPIIEKEWNGFLTYFIANHLETCCIKRHTTHEANAIFLRMTITNNVAIEHMKQGRLVKAEEMFIEALALKQQLNKRNPESTFGTESCLAILYMKNGKLDEAERVLFRAVQILAQRLEHVLLSAGLAITTLGILDAGEKREIKTLDTKVEEEQIIPDLADIKKILRLTSAMTSFVGIHHMRKGRLVDAEKMFIAALKMKEMQHERVDELALRTKGFLGIIYTESDKLDQAENMLMQALEGMQDTLGHHHELTLRTINNLGVLYMKKGILVKAEEMLSQALKGKKVTLGDSHPSTLDTAINMSILCERQGKLDKKDEILRNVRHIANTFDEGK